MSVAVIGSGAVAGLCASWLTDTPALCARTPIDAFTIRSGDEVRTVAVDPPPREAVDWVLLTVKAQDTESTKHWLHTVCGPDTVVAVLQNGVDHVERLQPLVGRAQVLPVLVMAAAERTGPGQVTHHMGNLLLTPEGDVAQRFTTLFDGAVVSQEADFRTAAWRKLLLNVGSNCVTALTQRRSEVLRVPEIRELCRTVLTETVDAGRSAGANLGPDDVERTLRLYDAYPDDNGSSMYYDRMAGRALEHDLIPGAVVRAAERSGLEVPVTRAIWALTRAVSLIRE